ncbi:MAG: glycosyltransferase family 1 protein [Candidatus Cloacimonetes bacterium]|nr:glycosyltransferase family 1 protein [Candidatus Cloacimonadota bacterium]
MKIGIDARTLDVKGGSKTYASNLLSNVHKRENVTLFGINNFENYKCVKEELDQQNPLNRLYYDNIKLPQLLKKYNINVFHGLKGVGPKLKSVKTIITVHDIHVLVYPQFAKFKDLIYWKYFSPMNIKKADKIISVSEATKKDLIEKLNIPADTIKVIHESYDSELYHIRQDSFQKVVSFLSKKEINITNKKIVLNVNTISPRKNVAGVIKAFNLIASNNSDLILIISGREGWKTNEIYYEFRNSPYKNRIYFIGFTPDDIVADLYNVAEVFVYPSFYEGFGLPILEAQACGCPVITSNVSSMPEIAGDGAILVDPYSVEEISNAMSKIVSHDELRNDLIQKGYNNCKRFSWEKCSIDTLKVYKEVYDEGC